MKKFLMAGILLLAMVVMVPLASWAASAKELNVRVQESLSRFKSEIPNGASILGKAKGILILPKVYKAGIGVGGEYGEGALLVGGKTVDYYNMVAGSWGIQLGAQRKTIVLVFMEDSALNRFRDSSGWKASADAGVTLVKIGAEGAIDTKTLNKPILAFVIGQRGLMYNLSLEGAKFTKIKK